MMKTMKMMMVMMMIVVQLIDYHSSTGRQGGVKMYDRKRGGERESNEVQRVDLSYLVIPIGTNCFVNLNLTAFQGLN